MRFGFIRMLESEGDYYRFHKRVEKVKVIGFIQRRESEGNQVS